MVFSEKRFFLFAFLTALIPLTSFGFTDKELLGSHLFKDQNLSLYRNQSCMSCHHPSAGFSDPENKKDPVDSPVSRGSDGVSFGGRNAPSAGYTGYSPVFHEAAPDFYVGGLFWDGRATGEFLQDPLAEQAKGPFLNPLEMAMKDQSAVVDEISQSFYVDLFLKVFPGTDFSDSSAQNIESIYDNMARAIAAFERSDVVDKFSSKFDRFWNACQEKKIEVSEIGISVPATDIPKNILTKSELNGLVLFNTKGKCSSCHVTTSYIDSTGQTLPPLFTDFSYDNLGLPVNPKIGELKGENQPIDYGLGARADIASIDPISVNDGLGNMVIVSQAQAGKFKVPTLRNISKNPPYGHNGYFSSLYDIVHFYNTRDLPQAGWPLPEVELNMNDVELGNLGLTYEEEMSLVQFMRTLCDSKN